MRHKSLLKCKKHFNTHLQRSYNKNGINAFEFIILEECVKDNLPDKEQEWINKHSACLYNHDLFVSDKRGNKNPFVGKHQ